MAGTYHQIDVVTKTNIYKVFAYDHRHQIAVVEDIEADYTPFKVLEGLSKDWEARSVTGFETLKEAYQKYDRLLEQLKKEKSNE